MGDDTPKRKPFWKREKIWFALIIGAVPILNEKLGLGLSIETVLSAVAPFAALLGIEGIGDWISRHHESRARRDITANGAGAGGK